MTAASTTDIRIAAVCTLALYVKYLTTLFIQGGTKFKTATRAPEDMAFAQRNPQQTAFVAETSPAKIEEAKATELRWSRIVGNDLENIPFGVILAWVSIIAGGNGTATSVCFVVFTIARIVHSVAFAHGVFLPRTIAFQIGVLSTLALVINAVVGSFN
ncbi:Aste57867_17622 [Aphanomyces stellatus]|uniref:Microsomal glutathione S-transferase 1 n=1 Tax=Aphanomyces stellatus TaxID=120398 RepID=A0A485L9F4_9STRA|nr:hypothetical protein As57867_017562 [Aphanomyces stellatus]VFT94373.1 Aste57867_17622 [Aphanomyces stellatus]